MANANINMNMNIIFSGIIICDSSVTYIHIAHSSHCHYDCHSSLWLRRDGCQLRNA